MEESVSLFQNHLMKSNKLLLTVLLCSLLMSCGKSQMNPVQEALEFQEELNGQFADF